MRKPFLITCLLLSTATIFSQIKLKPEVIEQANALIKKYPKQDFVSLKNKEVYSFKYSPKTKKVEAQFIFEEHIMGLKESLYFKEAVYYNEQSEVSGVSGKSYRNSMIKVYPSKKKYSSEGIFYDDAMISTFGFSLATRGDNVKYFYQYKYKDIKYFTRLNFHSYYPKEEMVIEVNVPDWLELEFVELNFEGYDIVRSETYNEKEKIKKITYSVKNLKPIIGGDFTISRPNQLPHVLVLSKSYEYKGEKNNLFATTDDLYSWYASLVKKMDNKPEELKEIVTELTAKAKTPQDKVENIFYWVQDNIRYIAYENGIMGFKPANANEVYKKKYGDCKGMANLTCEMLKIAGFDARLTWIGTRRIPYTYKTPSLAVDNHMITTLFLEGKKYYLDATEKGVAFNDYAHRIQGQDVMIENGEDYEIAEVPEFDEKHNLEKSVVNYTFGDNTSLVGNGINIYHGEEKNNMRYKLKTVSKADLEKRLGKYIGNYSNNVEVANVQLSDYSDRNLPVEFKYDLSVANQITEVANERYINLEMDFDFDGIKTEENRNMNFDFNQKVYLDRLTTLVIPEGFDVDYLPEPINVDNGEYTFDLTYSFNKETRTIEYKKNIVIKTGIVSVSNFENWNGTIKKLKTFYNDQIVLIKTKL